MNAPREPETHARGTDAAGPAVHGRAADFFRVLIARPVLLLTLFVTILVVGTIAYVRIPVQMMPDGFVEQGLQVFVVHPGSSAQENEEQVARVLEEELRTLPRLDQISSTSRSENVGIWVQFKGDTDMNFAKAEVRDRIERARPKLPSSVRDVGIWSWDQSSMPVMFFALLHPGDSKRTDFLVDEVIKRRLEAVDGVGRLEIWGTLDDSLRILLDEEKVKAANLDIGRLIRRLSADNFAEPLGEVEDGGRRILMRADMRFRDAAEIEAYPIDGGLTIGDVGHVESVKSIRERLFRIDGRYGYFGEVQKDGQANAVETARRLRAAIEELEKDPILRGEFEFLVLFDQGEFIGTSMKTLTDTTIEGGVFAVLILFLFLWRVRLTLLVALSIPVSALIAIAWLYFSGGSLNLLTMTSITLAMGMLVDNSIVVVENITRLKALGLPALEACARGVGEVGLAVLLSTLTSVVVFLPLIFMTENPRLALIFGQLGLPLCIALLASLLAALVFLPVQARGVLGARPAFVERIARIGAPIVSLPAQALGWIGVRLLVPVRGVLGVLGALERALLARPRALQVVLALVVLGAGALAWRNLAPSLAFLRADQALDLGPGARASDVLTPLVAAGAAVTLALAVVLFGVPAAARRRAALRPRSTRVGDVPRRDSIVAYVVDANRAFVSWTLAHRFAAFALGTVALASIAVPISNMKVASFGQNEETSRVNFWVELEENFTIAEAETEMIHYEDFLASKKAEYGFDRVANRFDATGGRVSLFWKKPPPPATLENVRRGLVRDLPRLAGHRLRFLDDESRDADSNSTVTFRLRGPDSEELARIGADAVAALENVPGLTDLRSPLGNAPPVVRVKLQSDVAQRLGVSAQSAFQNVTWALRGFQLPSFQEPGREVPLLIEYDNERAAGLSTLRDLDVYTGESSVPLTSFSELEFGRASRSIERTDGEASFTIQARVSDPTRQREVSARGRLALAGLDLPRGYSLADEDLVDARAESELKEIWLALGLSVVLVFLLMGILFESFVLPISVLFTIPFAVLGSYWTLYLTGTPMDSVGWIGVIILVGVVVNNGIVLVDCIHGLRAVGYERAAAVVEASGQRVRPILMTALTSVIGLLPMAVTEPVGRGIDYRALATCVAGGLTVSTVFTLWVVPLAYTLIEDVARGTSRILLAGIATRATATTKVASTP